MDETLKILLVASEAVPFAKVGGLADVAGSLPKALRRLGHDARLALPKYGRINEAEFGLRKVLDSLPVPAGSDQELASIFESVVEGMPAYLVGSDKYFDREEVYGYDDDGERFVFFCRAALEMLKKLDWRPDVIHCNDWHTGIIPNWLKIIYKDDPFFADAATVFTIHNLAYQGIFGPELLEFADLADYGLIPLPPSPPKLEGRGGDDLSGLVVLMARGILFADVINTVSEKYAQEILTPEYGERLDPILVQRQDRLFGILNGLDYEVWNPATDPHIAVNYDVAPLLSPPTLGGRKGGRVGNKLALQRKAELPLDADLLLIGMISRLADQKGFDILVEAIDELMELDLQFVLLGTGEERYHRIFANVAGKYQGQAAIFLKFDPALARRIYAGSDAFLMPSRYEPCGLGQMIAMRYGSVPIVRSTGGLADTVKDYDPATGQGNGFAFSDYSEEALLAAVERALKVYRRQDTWRTLMERGMRADFSWQASARKYVELYRQALKFRQGGP
ncbi:MAG: glycogen synthase [Chloroflexi bacterium]|nr:glycogen synthase [Chloroflexota bacterium]